ncbi:MAG: hypothetical protein PVF17_07775 [Ignavibacteria bacterium]
MIAKAKNRIPKRIKDYIYLIISVAAILAFVMYLAPEADKITAIEPLVNFIDEQGINAAAIYYTDIEEFSVAEINIRNSIGYPAVKRLRMPDIR